MDKKKSFLIVDGSSILVSAYYATGGSKDESELLKTKDGTYTNAVYSMLRTIFRILRTIKPDYIAFAFDAGRDTFRRTELGADFYKANRNETPSPLKKQVKTIQWALTRMGFSCFSSEHYEADDYAATLVRKFESPEINTYVLSKDHDYEQLVSSYTKFWRIVGEEKSLQMQEKYKDLELTPLNELPKNIFEYTEAIVHLEEGVSPKQIPALLGITGDSTDNIPGCKGVSSAAAPLLREYGSITNLYKVIEQSDEKKLAKYLKEELHISRNPSKALKGHKEDVILSEKLATMKEDITIIMSLNDFKVKINTEGYKMVLNRLEIKEL